MVTTVQERLVELKLEPEQRQKVILDATAAFRSMWFNKNHPLVDYLDKSSDDDLNQRRLRYNKLCGTTKFKYWNPKNKTVQGTWDKLPFKDNSKKLIVFDPPHKTSYTGSQRCKFKEIYGFLKPETWQSELRAAFREFFRVLEPFGILVVKWGSDDVNYKEIIACSPVKPLFGNITNGCNKADRSVTYWFCFMKPEVFNSSEMNQKEQTV
jgi:hypothetical protein